MRVNVRVRPSSGRQEVEKISEEEYKVWLKSPPEGGKANAELEKVLRKYFGKEVNVIRGKTSRRKVVEVNL